MRRWPVAAAPGLIRPITVGDLTDRCQVAAIPRGRLVAGCPGMNAVPGYFVPLPTYVNPWPARGRLPRYPGPDRPGRLTGGQPARRCLPGEGWNVSPSPRDQPEARTNRHCSVTGEVCRMCENWTYADSEAARRLV